jgi:cell division septation protein DedD
MSEDGFHEIQLNGKQLVFLFMTCTVVGVSIFLLGVLVGRGVRQPRTAQATEASSTAAVDPTAAAQRPPAARSSSDAAAPSSPDTLTYPERLEDPTPPAETLRESADAARTPSAKAGVREGAPERSAAKPPPAAAAQPPASAPAPAAESTTSEPAGNGFVVQVAAVRGRSEADAMARRLASKGYPSFVTAVDGAANMFRVRIGKYADRHQAEAIKARLEKEDQFKPFITR